MPPTTMDHETKELIGQFREFVSTMPKLQQAVSQLEEQMRGIPSTIENKLHAVRQTMFDPRGNYRGLMGTEAHARGFGLLAMAMIGGDQRAASALRSEFKDIAQRAMGTDTQAGGGGLVPIEYSSRIQRLVEEAGVFAANAFPMPMTSDSLTFQRRATGLSVFKTGQNQQAQESQPKFTTVNLNADEWNTLCLFPKSVEEDAAAALGELLAMEIAQAFAEALDTHGFMGDGTPDSLDVWGLVPRLKAINGTDDGGGLVLGSGNAWSELVEADFLKVVGQLPRYAQANAKWYCSSVFFWTVMAKITLAKGGVTAAEFAGERKLMFLGFPVEIVSAMPTSEANSQVPVVFGDLRLSSTHGRRKDLTIDRSDHVRFIERQVAVLATQRHAVANHTLGDATTAGPMIGLITAAS